MTSRTWADNDPTKPLSAARMNGIETDIQAALDQAAAAAAAVSSRVVPRTITATTYTLALTDEGQSLIFTSATGCFVTIPAAPGVPFPLGWNCELWQSGAGAITVGVGTGISTPIKRMGTLVSGGAGAVLGLANYGTNAWWLTGDTSG